MSTKKTKGKTKKAAPALFKAGDRVKINAEGSWANGREGTVEAGKTEKGVVLVLIDGKGVASSWRVEQLTAV
jgi:ribosomal protein L21E